MRGSLPLCHLGVILVLRIGVSPGVSPSVSGGLWIVSTENDVSVQPRASERDVRPCPVLVP